MLLVETLEDRTLLTTFPHDYDDGSESYDVRAASGFHTFQINYIPYGFDTYWMMYTPDVEVDRGGGWASYSRYFDANTLDVVWAHIYQGDEWKQQVIWRVDTTSVGAKIEVSYLGGVIADDQSVSLQPAVFGQEGKEETFRIKNFGDQTLELTNTVLENAVHGTSDYRISSYPSRYIVPGSYGDLKVRLKSIDYQSSGYTPRYDTLDIINSAVNDVTYPPNKFIINLRTSIERLVAYAGLDQSVPEVGRTVTLTGAGTYPPGGTTSFSWRFIATPPGTTAPTLSNPRGLTTTFVPQKGGIYELEWRLDYAGFSNTDSVIVNVSEKRSELGVTLDDLGNQRTLRDGDVIDLGTVVKGTSLHLGPTLIIANTGEANLDYQITPPGPPVSLLGRTLVVGMPPGQRETIILAIDPSTEGVLDGNLTIQNNSALNQFRLRVRARVVDVRADAGDDRTEKVCCGAVTLDGSRSTPAIEPGVVYQWSYFTGPDTSLALIDADKPVANFVPTRSGDYQFRLIVSFLGVTREDVVTVHVVYGKTLSGWVMVTDSANKGPIYGGPNHHFLTTSSLVGRGITVTPLDPSGPPVDYFVDLSTHRDGYYEIRDLAPGQYQIEAFSHTSQVKDNRFKADPVQIRVDCDRADPVENFVLKATNSQREMQTYQLKVSDAYGLYGTVGDFWTVVSILMGPQKAILNAVGGFIFDSVVGVVTETILKETVDPATPALVTICVWTDTTWNPYDGRLIPARSRVFVEWFDGKFSKRIYDRASDDQRITVAHSPVSLIVEDELGQRAGRDGLAGVDYSELPSRYIQSGPDEVASEKAVWLTENVFSDTYRIHVIGLQDGTFSLDIIDYRSFYTPVLRVEERPILVGQVLDYIVDSPVDAEDVPRLYALTTVTTTADSGPGSLRQAMLDANAKPGTDFIAFAIPGAGPHAIVPLSPLPEICDSVVVDATTQPGFMGTPLVEVYGTLAGVLTTADGLTVTGGSNTIRGLAVRAFSGSGIVVNSGSENVLERNFITENQRDGIRIDGSASNRIGGLLRTTGNVITANDGAGVRIVGSAATGNLVVGNFIGIEPDSLFPDRNASAGVSIENAPGNTVGGLTSGARNVIVGDSASAVVIFGAGASGNVVQGNYLGTDTAGENSLTTSGGATPADVVVFNAPRNVIGGAAPGARNVAAHGVEISGANSTGNVVQGNFLGVAANGTAALRPGNATGVGVRIVGASGNTIGGTAPGAGNVIGGMNVGVAIDGQGATGNVIQQNRIGTDAAGSTAIGNNIGVTIGLYSPDASGNTIGGTAQGAGNVISGNEHGVFLLGSHNAVQGNLIGLALAGLSALPNRFDSIFVSGTGNIVGGAATVAGNVIAGNQGTGVYVSNGPETVIQNNTIGTDASGSVARGNAGAGVAVWGTSGALITGNTIAHSGRAGVELQSDVSRVRILGNRIFDNSDLGIDVSPFGVTPNDAGDIDIGPNGLQNFPVLSSAVAAGGRTMVRGSLSSAGLRTFRIEFFASPLADSSGHGEGQQYLWAADVTTDATGRVDFAVTISVPVSVGHVVTATATDADGNTSEFSRAVPVQNEVDIVDVTPDPRRDPVSEVGIVFHQQVSGVDKNDLALTRDGASLSLDSASLDSADGVTWTLGQLGPLTDIGGSYVLTLTAQGSGIVDGSGRLLSIDAVESWTTDTTPPAVAIDPVQPDPRTANVAEAVVRFSEPVTGFDWTDLSLTRDGGPNLLASPVLLSTADQRTWTVSGIWQLTDAEGVYNLSLISSGSEIADVAGNPLTADAEDSWTIVHPTTFTVTTTADSGPGSLRQAILDANADPGQETILFNIPGPGPYSIAPLTRLPDLTDTVVIDGTTQPGYAGVPLIELDGSNVTFLGWGLMVRANNCVVRGLVINRFVEAAIHVLSYGGGTVIEGNYIGIDISGTVARGNGGGVIINGSPGNRVGGTTPAARNVIAGNGYGVFVRGTGNVVQGNFIGTDATGTLAIGNTTGVSVASPASHHNLIGGDIAGAGNVIAGNSYIGLEIGGEDVTDNLVQGNLIGTDVTGTKAIGNEYYGVWLTGGTARNTIGGVTPGARNVISANKYYNLLISSANDNAVQGNFIGTDISGTIDLGNVFSSGVRIDEGARNFIGGTTVGEGNLISGNSGGISINGVPAVGNRVSGNKIGTDVTGTLDLGNGSGVWIGGDASDNMIGGTALDAGNVVAFNDWHGVVVDTGVGNAILGNAIHSNVRAYYNDGLGISLGGVGFAIANDNLDADTGPNQFQNYPELSWALSSGGTTTVVGVLRSVPLSVFRLEFFANRQADASGYGEGERFLGTMNVTTDGLGVATFTTHLVADIPEGQWVSATATDSAGNTSGFSQSNRVVGAFTVTTAADSGPGSLRQAILEANARPGADTVRFDVGPAGVVQTIRPQSALPTVTDPLMIEATTEPGYAGVPLIELDGSGAGLSDGLDLAAPGSGARGLAVNNFGRHGVRLRAAETRLEASVVGLDPSGLIVRGNAGNGVWVESSAAGAVIGGAALGEGNVIGGNGGAGVQVDGATGVRIEGNRIGGVDGLGNVGHGVLLVSGAGGNTVGGTAVGAGNTIVGNGGAGVFVASGSAQTVLGNAITDNVGLGIDLAPLGVGVDPAVNLGYEPPILVSAWSGLDTTVHGSIQGTPGVVYRVEFFLSPIIDASGHGEGATLIGRTDVVANDESTVEFVVAFPGHLPEGQWLTATATDADGNSSEFSAGVVIASSFVDFAVTTTADDGPGSLRQAIVDANDHPGADRVVFAIAGDGIQTIRPLSALPTVTDALVIDAATQPDYAGEPLVELDGSAAGLSDGLDLAASGSIVRGLCVNRFARHGVRLRAAHTRLEASVVGLDPSGLLGRGNAGSGVWVQSSATGAVIGGAALGEGNVIGGNGGAGVQVDGATGVRIEGNRIGGVDGLGNVGHGVLLANGAGGNTVGGTAVGAGNTVVGNGGAGVFVASGSAQTVLGNAITDNVGLGIDLAPLGVGVDTAVNLGQTPPELDFVSSGVVTTIAGCLQGRSSAPYRLEFFVSTAADPTGFGEGQSLLGSAQVTADATGLAPFTLAFSEVVPSGHWISATATDFEGNTTEFARSLEVTNHFTVMTTADGGPGSLRQAILDANAHPGPDEIRFAIPGTGVHVLQPSSSLPSVTDAVTIDGYTQPGASANTNPTDRGANMVLRIELDGTNAGSADALQFVGGPSVVRGLIINRFGKGAAVHLVSGGHTVEGNLLGLDPTGTTTYIPNTLALPNQTGVLIDGSAANLIGGASAAARNLIVANVIAVHVVGAGATANVVQGNFLGTGITGTEWLLAGSYGVAVADAPNNLIGGTAIETRNLIASHTWAGVLIQGTNATGNVVAGNFVGTDVHGTAPLGNRDCGVWIRDAKDNRIGGRSLGEGNLISGNGLPPSSSFLGYGIRITGVHATGNLIQGNLVGTDVTGISPIGNAGVGVSLDGGNNQIGGTEAGAGNVISDNIRGGLSITGVGNIVQGNRIGTDITGTAPLGNRSLGIWLSGRDNLIGGNSPGAANVISANQGNGIELGAYSSGNRIEGNRIGTDISGTLDLGNTQAGIRLAGPSEGGGPGNIIGGSAFGAGNVISGNERYGLLISSDSLGNVVQGNLIGTAIDGLSPLANELGGVFLSSYSTGSRRHVIGGSTDGAGNRIAFNQGPGITLRDGQQNSVIANSVFANAGLELDLGADGITPNDVGDGDSGANGLQNYPVLEWISGEPAKGMTTVHGTLQSTPDTGFVLHFYSSSVPDPSGAGQSENYLGSASVRTDNQGNTDFTAILTTAVSHGHWVTATATDPSGNTSEFSLAKQFVEYVDNGDESAYSEIAGEWADGALAGGYLGDYRQLVGTTGGTAVWTQTCLPGGTYAVFASWVPFEYLSNQTSYTIRDGATERGTVVVDQRTSPSDAIVDRQLWTLLGVYTVDSGTLTVELTAAVGESVVADTIRIVPGSGDLTRPYAAITAPVSDPLPAGLDALTVTFSEPVVGVDLGDFRLMRDGTESALPSDASISSNDGVSWTLSHLIESNRENATYELTLIAAGSAIVDLAGNSLNEDAGVTWVVSKGPEVVSVGPNTHSAPARSELVVTFNQDIDPSTVQARTISAFGTQSGPLTDPPAVRVVEGKVIKLIPNRFFLPGELVYATVTTGIGNATGGTSDTPFVWQFVAATTGGSGQFSDSGQNLGNSPTQAVTLGDLDGDGDPDAVFAQGALSGSPGQLTVWLNDGTGDFSETGESFSGDSYSIALGDVDNDNDLDIYQANFNQPDRILFNDGTGHFTDSGQSLGNGSSVDISLADLDGDGDLDAFVADRDVGSQVWLNDGIGCYTDSGQNVGTLGSSSIAIGDVDHDGDLDAFVGRGIVGDPQPNEVWLNDGHGNFTDSGQRLGSATSLATALGDLDDDGDLDVFAADYDAPATVWWNDGQGNFTDSGQRLGQHQAQAVALGDLDGDGDLDAYVADNLVDSVWLNDGRGQFLASSQLLPDSCSRDIALGDVDGDGDLDAVIANLLSSEHNDIWLNIDRSPTVTVDFLTSADPSPMLTGTIDDPMASIVARIGGRSFPANNNGDGTWTLPQATISPRLRAGVYDVVVTATDPAGNVGTDSTTNELTVWAVLAERHVFYNRSAWDGNDAAASAADDQAIASDKSALLASQKATFANYTSYSRGINGIMIDITNLADPAGLSVADFEFRIGNNNDTASWSMLALDPSQITIAVRPGEGVDGSDRVTIIFPDGAIKKTWLQVTVKATPAAGLAAPDVHYWGNAMGDSGNSANDTAVNVVDALGVRANPHTLLKPAPIDDAYDFNRDKQVNVQDELLVRAHPTTLLTDLTLIDLTGSGGGGEGEGGWSGDAWGSWAGGNLLDMRAPLDTAVSLVALVVPSTSGSDLLRAAALTSVAQRTGSAVTMGRWSPLPAEDLVWRDTSSTLLALPVASSAAISSNTVAMSKRTMARQGGWGDLSAPLTSGSWETGRFEERFSQPSNPDVSTSTVTRSESPVDEDCLVGPLKEEQSHGNTSRTDWAPGSHGRDKQRTLDEALQELLAEWEQF